MFKMPVGLYEKALPAALSWEERLAAAGQAGYDFVEISIDESDERLARLDWSASERAALRRSIANTGVQDHDHVSERSSQISARQPHRRNSAGRGRISLRKAIEFAGDIGLRVVQVMGYDVFYETSDERNGSNFVDGLRLGARWAEQSGVMLGLENLDTPFVENLSKALAIIREIDSALAAPVSRYWQSRCGWVLPSRRAYPGQRSIVGCSRQGCHAEGHPWDSIWKGDRAISRDVSGAGANGLLGIDRH